MNSFDSFFFREDSRGLSVLNASIPGYSVLIGADELRLRQSSISEYNRRFPRPLAIRWHGPRPSNERPVIDELWKVVEEYYRRKTGATDGDGLEDRPVSRAPALTVSPVPNDTPSRPRASTSERLVHGAGPGSLRTQPAENHIGGLA